MIGMPTLFALPVVGFALEPILAQAAETEARPKCLGIFGSPEHLWRRGVALSDYYINAVFLSHSELSDELIRRCHREGARVYADFGVFCGAALAEQYPELWPINEKGQRQAKYEWYLGLCPTVEWFRRERLRLLQQVAADHEIDGIWLDFIRYPGHWELRVPHFEQGCFCESCLGAFTRLQDVTLPTGTIAQRAEVILSRYADEWTRFKCRVIRDFCHEARAALKRARPNALLGAFVVPWTQEDHDGAIRRIIGQDFELLASEIDVFSPMSYHAMCGQPVEWIGTFNAYLRAKTSREVWPIIQATEREPRYGDAPVDAHEFRRALLQGVSGGATGVIVFRLVDCTEDNGKLQVLRDVYGSLAH